MTRRHQGRERIVQRDREADAGQRPQEYRQGQVSDEDDPLVRARREAVEESTAHGENQPPGVTPLEEAWQRDKQMLGQDASEPGLPRTWRGGEGPTRRGPEDVPPAGESTQG